MSFVHRCHFEKRIKGISAVVAAPGSETAPVSPAIETPTHRIRHCAARKFNRLRDGELDLMSAHGFTTFVSSLKTVFNLMAEF
jgi:hypothetical protein